MTTSRPELSRSIEESVRQHGVTPSSVWLDQRDAVPKGVRRAEAIFRMIGDEPAFSVLDVGCGPGLAVPFLEERYGSRLAQYCGVDISAPLVEAARTLWPGRTFLVRDVVSEPLEEAGFDYTALNGVLTAKYSLPHDEMEQLAETLLQAVWRFTRVALSFNVMSTHVDWTREDLFHWSLDRAAAFCVNRLSRHMNVIADYGLYEYTVQVFRAPRTSGPAPQAWVQAETPEFTND